MLGTHSPPDPQVEELVTDVPGQAYIIVVPFKYRSVPLLVIVTPGWN